MKFLPAILLTVLLGTACSEESTIANSDTIEDFSERLRADMTFKIACKIFWRTRQRYRKRYSHLRLYACRFYGSPDWLYRQNTLCQSFEIKTNNFSEYLSINSINNPVILTNQAQATVWDSPKAKEVAREISSLSGLYCGPAAIGLDSRNMESSVRVDL